MKKYEEMFIVRANLEQEAIKAEIANVTNIFTSNGSNVLECKEWGLRELAYEIEHTKKGYYVWCLVDATKEAINEHITKGTKTFKMCYSCINYTAW